MKKSLSLICLSLLLLSSCGDTTTPSIIAPSGTPALGLANFYQDNKDLYSFDIKDGADALVAAFTSGSHDIIVAPTNVGAKVGRENYLLYQTIVWGNLYVANTEGITSFEGLQGKEVVVFGGTSTIIMNALTKYYNMEVNFKNADSVADANKLLTSGESSIIVSAEPSLSKIKKAKENISTIDLQEEWKKMSNSSCSYPQASIFFKKSLKGKIDDTLIKLTESINKTISDPKTSAENAVNMNETFETLGEETLISAIPNCHYGIEENQKEAIEFYFNKLNELGMSAQYGGTLPGEEFYYSI